MIKDLVKQLVDNFDLDDENAVEQMLRIEGMANGAGYTVDFITRTVNEL